MNSRMLVMLACIGMFVTLSPRAKADEWNKKTQITFSGPVEIPGQVLPAGTYVFKLADSQSDRNIVQVFNKDQTHVYGTFLAIPDYRMHPTGKTIIRFEERAAGSPEAVKAWFYPGDNYGNEFVYPKTRAMELARQNHQPVPSMPTEMAGNTTQPATTMKESSVATMQKAPIKAEKPTGEEVEITEVFPPHQERQTSPTQATAQSTTPHTAAETTQMARNNLPKTASSTPLIALIGLLSLAAAFSLKLFSARVQ